MQADLDFHDNLENSLESIEDNSCPGPVARQFSRDASTSTVSIQGSGNHYHACAVDEDFDADFDPSILPPPDPWIDSITEDPLEAVQRSVCHRDGHWFLKLLQAERDRMEGWCQQMEREERENNLPEESKCVAAYAHAQTPGALGGAWGGASGVGIRDGAGRGGDTFFLPVAPSCSRSCVCSSASETFGFGPWWGALRLLNGSSFPKTLPHWCCSSGKEQ